MYIVINKTTDETAVIKEKTPLANYIGVSLMTIYRRAKEKMWETDGYIVYKADIILLKSRRGGGKGNINSLKS